MPAIMIFIFMGLVLTYEKFLDFINIPRSTLSYAKVIHKEVKGGKGMNKTFNFYKIIFEIENAEAVDIAVPFKVYESVSIGSRGVLVHTYTRFRGFHVDKKIPDIIKPKQKQAAQWALMEDESSVCCTIYFSYVVK
jgi:hypothetical protein